MGRIRTHNRRAKRPPYAVFARKRHHARKVLRLAFMYGMGAHKLAASFRQLGEAAKGLGTITGRIVSKGPEPQYQIPKQGIVSRGFVATNFAEQEARALIYHKAALDAAREAGHKVIEHTYADATIIVKEDDK